MRVLILATAGACLLAAPAAAQSASGLRTLSWPGKVERAAPPGGPAASDLRRVPLIPHAGASFATAATHHPVSTPSPLPITPERQPRQGLTPADAWLRPLPSSAPSYRAESAPPAAPRPAPAQPTPAPPAPVRAAAPIAPSPAPRAPTAELVRAPERASTPEPVRAAAAQPRPEVAAPPAPPQPQPTSAAPADPMAPRPDAPIFSIQRPAAGAAPTASGGAQAAPGDQAPRYYSVHRQNGRTPDAIPQPQPTWLDALPVDLERTPQSDDLAAPPQPPQMVRNRDGRLVPLAPAGEGDGDRN